VFSEPFWQGKSLMLRQRRLSLSMQFFHTAFLLFRIVGAGISVVLSQQLGYNNPIAAETAARTALLASFVMGLIAAAVLWFGSDRLLLHFEVPEEVRLQAKPLMLWLAPCVLLDAIGCCYGLSHARASVRGPKLTRHDVDALMPLGPGVAAYVGELWSERFCDGIASLKNLKPCIAHPMLGSLPWH